MMQGRTGFPAEEITEKHREAVRRSRELLEIGKQFRATEREEVWRRSQDQYEGNHWERSAVEDPTADLIVVNVSFSTVNTIIPYITSEEPRFLVAPFSADATVKNARMQQGMLNRTWRRIDGKGATRVAAEDYLICGDAYLKPSWSIVDRTRADGSTYEMVQLYVDAVSPWDVWIDPFATGIKDARWVCQRIILTRREVEADDRFDQSLVKDLPWGHWERDEDQARAEKIVTSDEEWIAIYEFYDRIDRAMYVFTESGPEKPLRVVEEIDCPIIPLSNYRITHSPYHMGELEQLWPMQEELNKTRSQLITHRRRNIGKYFVRRGALDEAGYAALQSPIINEAIEVIGDTPLDSVVKPAQLTQLSAEAYGSADSAMRDIYEISGVNEYLRGATPEIRRTATEASIIEGASNVKTRAKLSDVERAVRDVGEYLLAIMREVFPETDVDEMSMMLTGPEAEQIARLDAAEQADQAADDGASVPDVNSILSSGTDVESVTLTPSDEVFVGEYEVTVESGSTEMRNPIFKEQKYREMAMSLIQLAPALQQSGVAVNLRKVLELWFEAAGIVDVEGMFDAAPQAAPGMNPMGLPGDPSAILGMLGQQGGSPQGEPNVGAVQPPTDGITAENSGALPQAG